MKIVPEEFQECMKMMFCGFRMKLLKVKNQNILERI